MSERTRYNNNPTCKVFSMPTYFTIWDFPIGLSVPYISASDGVFFPFGRTRLAVCNDFYRKAL